MHSWERRVYETRLERSISLKEEKILLQRDTSSFSIENDLLQNLQTMEVHSDVLELIVSRMSNQTIRSLSLVPVLWDQVSSFADKQDFWHLRVENLMKRDLPMYEGDWKEAYYLLEEAILQNNPFSMPMLGDKLVVQILLEVGYDPSDNDNYAIGQASISGYTEVVKLLLNDKRVDPSADDNYAIGRASLSGYTEVVKLLLNDKRVDPSDSDNYAIRLASAYGRTEVVKLLLQDPRVDPSADNNYAIKHSAEDEYVEVVKLLLQDPRVDPSRNIVRDMLREFRSYSPSIINTLIQDRNTDIQTIDHNSIAEYIHKYISDSIEGYRLLGRSMEYLDVYTSFNKFHYNMLLQQIIFKRLDLEYYLEWILKELRENTTSEEVRRIFSSAARSVLDDVPPIHLSPSFTAYRGFILLAVSDNAREILRTLSEEEGVTQYGLELAGGLIGAFLGRKKLES